MEYMCQQRARYFPCCSSFAGLCLAWCASIHASVVPRPSTVAGSHGVPSVTKARLVIMSGSRLHFTRCWLCVHTILWQEVICLLRLTLLIIFLLFLGLQLHGAQTVPMVKGAPIKQASCNRVCFALLPCTWCYSNHTFPTIWNPPYYDACSPGHAPAAAGRDGASYHTAAAACCKKVPQLPIQAQPAVSCVNTPTLVLKVLVWHAGCLKAHMLVGCCQRELSHVLVVCFIWCWDAF